MPDLGYLLLQVKLPEAVPAPKVEILLDCGKIVPISHNQGNIIIVTSKHREIVNTFSKSVEQYNYCHLQPRQ